MEHTWRTLSKADIPAVTALRAAAEAVDETGMHLSEEDVAEEFADADLNFPDGSLGVAAGDELVAYGLARIRGNAVGTHRMLLEGVVHPAHRRRGLGRELVERLIACSRVVHASHYQDMPLSVDMIVRDRADGHRALATELGFTDQRRFYDMRVSLADPPPLLEAAAGLEVVPYTRERDEDTRLARNEAFAEHWGTTAASPQVWAERFTGMKGFVPGASFLMVDSATNAVAGFVLGQHSEAEALVTGVRELWVADVGTLEAYRGKGVAGALLSRTLTAAREAGFERAGLSVDSANSTPALGVYERAGFAVTGYWSDYGLPVSPVG
ncbi:GNAT family N-acetyltransferase [Lentzea tibetensis]|uniref:GNAT family N-acetyltransferase n=1 Tax=Lentzea tibetensis TaxID=2591470 RepID=A0A563ER34_9PSEU|nr:GNAT family N-acetyltransferase [Lentzea tibetensis]TWP50157.1 GNAT family N-acetyltransferase [Lentzea tibetensis]